MDQPQFGVPSAIRNRFKRERERDSTSPGIAYTKSVELTLGVSPSKLQG